MITERFAGLRADLAFIAHWVTPGARVLDLGCGDGAMMEYLRRKKAAPVTVSRLMMLAYRVACIAACR